MREERAKQQYDDIQRQLNDKIQQLQGDSAGDSDAEELRRLRQKAHQLEVCRKIDSFLAQLAFGISFHFWQTQLATAQAELEAALREKIDAVAASQHAQQQANRTQADYEVASAAYEAERQGHLAQLSQLKVREEMHRMDA